MYISQNTNKQIIKPVSTLYYKPVLICSQNTIFIINTTYSIL